MPYPLRVATVAIAGMMFAWAIFQVMVKLVHPYKMGREEGRKVAEIKERLSSQRRKNATLYREVVYLKSAEGAESAARRAHYHRPGEIIYLLAPQTTAPDTETAPPPLAPPSSTP